MTPVLANPDQADGSLGNAVPFSDLPLGQFAEQIANFIYLRGCQLVARVGFTSFHDISDSSFIGSVPHIVSLSSTKQMICSHAARIVALVKNERLVIRNRSALKHKASPRSSNPTRTTLSAARTNRTVSSPISRCYPDPARPKIRSVCRYGAILINLCPKAFSKRGRETLPDHPVRGNFVHCLVSCPLALRTRRAFPL